MTKNFCAIATVILCTFPPASLSARSEYILGGTDGNAWTTPIGEEGGVYVIIDGQSVRQVAVTTTPHGVGGDTLIHFASDEYPSSILPRFFDPSINIALGDTESKEVAKVPFLYAGGFATTTDGCAVVGQHTPITKPMFDGDVRTAQFRRITLSANLFTGGRLDAPLTASAWPGGTVIDFEAAVPINRIRFFPRLSSTDDAVRPYGVLPPNMAKTPPSNTVGDIVGNEAVTSWGNQPIKKHPLCSEPVQTRPTIGGLGH